MFRGLVLQNTSCRRHRTYSSLFSSLFICTSCQTLLKRNYSIALHCCARLNIGPSEAKACWQVVFGVLCTDFFFFCSMSWKLSTNESAVVVGLPTENDPRTTNPRNTYFCNVKISRHTCKQPNIASIGDNLVRFQRLHARVRSTSS